MFLRSVERLCIPLQVLGGSRQGEVQPVKCCEVPAGDLPWCESGLRVNKVFR